MTLSEILRKYDISELTKNEAIELINKKIQAEIDAVYNIALEEAISQIEYLMNSK